MSFVRKSEDRFRLAVEAASAAMIVTDADGLIQFANAEVEHMFGYDASELVGKSIDILVPEAARRSHASLRQSFMANPSKRRMGIGRDLKATRRDGSEFPVEIGLAPITTEHGTSVLATIVDITARLDAENALRQRAFELERFRLAVEASPAAAIVADAEGLIQFANAETERMFGYVTADLIGKSIDILVPQAVRHTHGSLRQSFFANPSKREMGIGRDLKATRRDGSEFPVEIGLTPIVTEHGTSVLATIIDITARRDAEASLRQHASELERANERLAQFAFVASHDLQEPLRKVAAFSDLLREANAASNEAEMIHAINVIQASSLRARQLVDDLLAYSRTINDAQHLEDLDMREEIKCALNDLSEMINETGSQITADAPHLRFRADRIQFDRLMQNIVSNAIKYRKPGQSAKIHITAKFFDENSVRIAIADNGIGIEPKYATTIFEPFKRLHSRAHYPGTGIGLAICKSIADRHGWDLSVDSQLGQGATFFITIPVPS